MMWKAWKVTAFLSDNFYTCSHGTLNVPEVGGELTLGSRSTQGIISESAAFWKKCRPGKAEETGEKV